MSAIIIWLITAYISTVGALYLASVIGVNEGFKIQISHNLENNNCEKYTFNPRQANPLNIINTIMNFEYFLADYRAKESILTNEKCLGLLINSATEATRTTNSSINTIIIMDDKLNTVSKFTFLKRK